jgi:Helix-turn-helix domain of resolvase
VFDGGVLPPRSAPRRAAGTPPSGASTWCSPNLIPGGAGRNLGADHAAELLRRVPARDATAKTLRALAAGLVGEVRQLDRRIAKAATDIQTAVSASATTLTDVPGLGALTAGKILAHLGDVDRFRSASPATPAPPRSRCPPARGPPPTFPRRRSPAELLPARHRHHPSPPRHPRQGLLPQETIHRNAVHGCGTFPNALSAAPREQRRARWPDKQAAEGAPKSKADHARRMHTSGESVSTTAATLGVSRATAYRVVAE